MEESEILTPDWKKNISFEIEVEVRHRSTDPVPMTKDEARPARAAKPLTDPVPTSKAKKFMLSVPGVIPSLSGIWITTL